MMTNEELRGKVIGCAYKVHNHLKSGFLEKVYENALRMELEAEGLFVEQQKPIDVFYKGQLVGDFQADLLVEGCLIVELKAVRAIASEHEAQLVNYLTATGIDNGLLINFGLSVDVKHKFRVYRKT